MSVEGSYAVGSEPVAMTVGDLDRDGHLDVIVGDHASKDVSVLLGDGRGGLTASAPVTMGAGTRSIALGDVNRDGSLDIATSGDGSTKVFVRLGDGDAGFGNLKTVDAGSVAPVAVAIADLNNDGKPDLITANADSDSIGVFRGDGHGAFDAPRAAPYSAPVAPDRLVVTDLNADGNRDLVASSTRDRAVVTMLGDGTGRLVFSARRDLDGAPVAIAAAAVDQTSGLDVVTAVANNDAVDVITGNGLGGFTGAGTTTPLGSSPTALALTDANIDGRPDVLSTDSDGLSMRLGDGTGAFREASTSPWLLGDVHALVASDLDEDGLVDAAIAVGDHVVVALNRSTRGAASATAAVHLGDVPVGSSSAEQWVTVAGTGLPTQITNVSVDGADFDVVDDACSGRTVADAGATCDVGIRFVPTMPGDRSGLLHVATEDEDSVIDVALSGHGVDTDPPETTITRAPPGQTTDTDVSFAFESDEPNSTFLCSVDGADPQSCASPFVVTLSVGRHSFTVAAIDVAGNADPTPASAQFEIVAFDTVPPETTITEHPAALTNDRTPTFRFIADGEGATFACSVDGADPVACASPFTTDALEEGNHSFAATAVDVAGNVDPTPDVFTFTVDLTAPRTTISGPAHATKRTARYTFRFSENVAIVRCSIDGSGFSVCKTPFSARSLRAGSHTLRVEAIDEAGNAEIVPATKHFAIARR